VQSHAYAWVSHDQEQALRMSSRQLKMQQGVLQAENIE
jgi:ABC-type iron transport system FetAB ATPase subunit